MTSYRTILVLFFEIAAATSSTLTSWNLNYCECSFFKIVEPFPLSPTSTFDDKAFLKCCPNYSHYFFSNKFQRKLCLFLTDCYPLVRYFLVIETVTAILLPFGESPSSREANWGSGPPNSAFCNILILGIVEGMAKFALKDAIFMHVVHYHPTEEPFGKAITVRQFLTHQRPWDHFWLIPLLLVYLWGNKFGNLGRQTNELRRCF